MALVLRRNLSLVGVHPLLIQRAERVSDTMAAQVHPVMATDAGRTDARQAALYAQGRTKPGPIVTYADGKRSRSKHQRDLQTGYYHALDFAFLIDGPDLDSDVDDPDWADTHPWPLFGETVVAEGLVWGGSWQRPDRPHVQLVL